LTSDYLKQLQLTKQLEQKAKDAAKFRKSAEDKLAEAERAVAAALSLGIDAKEAQKALTDGRTAFGRRDYNAALAAAESARATADNLQKTLVNGVLSSADGILAMIEDRSEERQRLEELLESSRGSLEEGRSEEAMTEAKAALESVKAYADRRVTEMFAQVKRSIDLAEKEGIATAAKKQALAKAVKLHGDGNLEESLNRLAACYKSVHESFSKLIGDRSTSLLETAEQVAVGGDMSPVSVPVARAQECLAHGQFEEAMFLLGEGQKALSPLLSISVQNRLAEQLPRSYWLREQGANIGRFATASKKATEAAKAGQSEEALEWLRRAEKALRDGEAEVFLMTIEGMRPRLLIARRFNLDITPMLTMLEDSRQETAMGRGREALELVQKASEELDRRLGEIAEMEAVLDKTREVFLEAGAMKVMSPEAGEMVRAAREAALAGRLTDALGGLTQAREVLLRTVLERLGPQLLESELKVAIGLSMGASVEDDSEVLEEIEDDLRNGHLKGIAERLSTMSTTLEGALMTAAQLAVVEAEQVTSSNYIGVNLSEVREKVKQARVLMERREWRQSFVLAQEAVEEANSIKRASLVTLKEQTLSLLGIGRQLGIDPQTIDLWSSTMSSDDSEPSEALRSLAETYNHARVQVKEELARSFAQLQRASSSAHRKGVTTEHVDQLAEEGTRALSSFEVEVSFAKLQAAEKELEKTTALHNEVYDLIVLLSRLTSEIQVPSGSKVQPLLKETKRLFEAGLYDGARTSARNCYREAETIGAHILVPRKVQEVQQLLPVARQLDPGIEGEGEIEAATELVRKGKAAEAMSQLKDLQKRLTDTINDGILSEIGELRATLDKEDLGRDEVNTMAVIEKAESLLADQRYADALRAVRFARSETAQAVNVLQASQQELVRVEGVLEEMSSLGFEVREARLLLEQARRYRSSGRFNLVAEMARRAEHSACIAAGEQTRKMVEGVEKDADVTGIAGTDLEGLRASVVAGVSGYVERRRYVEALQAIEQYRERLQGMKGLKESCASSLDKVREKLSPLPGSSLLVAETSKLLTQAQKALEEGSFESCWSIMTPCRASADAAVLWHQGCSRRLEEVRSRLTADKDAASNAHITSLLDSAGKALAEGRYEDMNRDLLRAERIFDRGQRMAARRGLSELVNLARLYPFLGLTLKNIPAEALPLLDRRISDLETGASVNRALAAMRGTVCKAIITKGSKAKTVAGKKGNAEAVNALLKDAERYLAEGRLDRAACLVREAEVLSEATVAEVTELRELYRRYEQLEPFAESLGEDGGWYQEFRASFTSKSIADALKHMRQATSLIDRATADQLPRLVLTSNEVSNTGASPALGLVLDGVPGSDEIDLATVLWPRTSVPLPRKGKDGKVVLSYRALFVPQPFAAVLGPTQ